MWKSSKAVKIKNYKYGFMADIENSIIKILQVGRDINGTGGGRVILETSKHMANQGYMVKILTDVDVPDKLRPCNIDITPIGRFLNRWSPGNRVFRVVRHFSQLLTFSFFGTISASSYSRKGWTVLNHNAEIFCGDILVLHNVFRAEYEQDTRGFVRKNIRWLNPTFTFRLFRENRLLNRKKAFAISAVSSVTAQEAEKYFEKSVPVYAINNGVNTDHFYLLDDVVRAELRKEMGIVNDEFILLFVGHEFERKGLGYIIESLAYQPKNVKLWVVGGRGSNQDKCQMLAEKYGVRQMVRFFGTDLNTVKYYQIADLFVFPSIYETWALVGLEAMACGVPALMTPVGGIPEYLKNGVNGFFIKQDASDIAEKVQRLMNDPELMGKMKTAARETSIQYSWETVARKYLSLIRKVAREKAVDA